MSVVPSDETQKKMKRKKRRSKDLKGDDSPLFKTNTVSSEVQRDVNETGRNDSMKMNRLPSLETTRKHSFDKKTGATQRTRDQSSGTNVHSRQYSDDTVLGQGEIEFLGYNNHVGGRSPYIRVTPSTSPASIWNVLTNRWNLPIPDLVISITGGLKCLKLKPKPREKFKRGLLQTASTTGAWIITEGFNGGIIEFIGEAVREHLITSRGRRRIVMIGMPVYEHMKNKLAFPETKTAKSGYEDDYSDSEYLHVAEYDERISRNATDGSFTLNHNHTNFILLENKRRAGNNDQTDDQLRFRASLEHFMSDSAHYSNQPDKTQCYDIPVIKIVIGGGFKTLRDIVESLKNNIPVMIMAGSGRLADLIAKEFLRDEKENETFVKEEISRSADDIGIAQENLESFTTCLQEVLSDKNVHLVNVYNIMDPDSKEFDVAALDALLKAKESNTNAELALTLAWNRCDIAEKKILKSENRLCDFDDLMVKALIQNKHRFVRLFLEQGIDVSHFVDKFNLWNLFSGCLHFHSDKVVALLISLMSKYQRTWIGYFTCKPAVDISPDHGDLVTFIGKVMASFLSDDVMNPFPDLVTNRVENKVFTMTHIKDEKVRNIGQQKALQTLFLWAVLFNRKDMAFEFWKVLSRYNIAAALVACAMLRQMSKYADHIEALDLSEDLLDNSRFFEHLATGVLTQCYEYDQDLSFKLLVQKNHDYGKTTVMFIAGNNYQLNFMSHTCCQSLLRRLWKGKIAMHVPTLQIILTIICPLFIPFLKFVSSDKTGQRQDNILDEPTKRFYNVSLFGSSNKYSISFPRAVIYFYFAPVSIFWSNVFTYLIFLGVFSLFVLTELHPDHYSIYEYVVYGWVASVMVEQFREIIAIKKNSLKHKVQKWFHGEWNRFDVIDNTAFTLSVILRFSLNPKNFVWARVAFSLTLALFVLRFLELFLISKDIGPKVIMIRRMLKDLLFFFAILVVFLFSFGLAYQANLYPNALANMELLKQVVYIPYFQIYGELFLDNFEGKEPTDCTFNETEWRYSGVQRCPESNPLLLVLLGVYMLATNILLVNLLIAMFAHTFNKVQENSRQIWRFHRCSLVYKYCDRPVLVPPFILISHMIRLIRSIAMKCCKSCTRRHKFRLNFHEEESNAIALFERRAVKEYLQKYEKETKDTLDTKIVQIAKGVETSKECINYIQKDSEKRDRDLAEIKFLCQNQSEEIRLLQQNVSEISTLFSRFKPLLQKE